MNEHVVNNAILVFVILSTVISLVQTIVNLLATTDKREFEVIDMVNLALGVGKTLLLLLASLGLSEILDLGP